jgi:hypothetical protein
MTPAVNIATADKTMEQYQTDCLHLKVSKQNNKKFSDLRFFPFATGVNTPMLHLDLQIYLRLFEKNLNSPYEILGVLGETDSWKKPEVENLVVMSI